MPDLAIETGWWCRTNERWEATVQGNGGRVYKVYWERDHRPGPHPQFRYRCTCKGFIFRGDCRHVDIAAKQHCRWNEEMEPGVQPERIEGVVRCPHCHGDVVPFRVGV